MGKIPSRVAAALAVASLACAPSARDESASIDSATAPAGSASEGGTGMDSLSPNVAANPGAPLSDSSSARRRTSDSVSGQRPPTKLSPPREVIPDPRESESPMDTSKVVIETKDGRRFKLRRPPGEPPKPYDTTVRKKPD